jgi:hypothetical protein
MLLHVPATNLGGRIEMKHAVITIGVALVLTLSLVSHLSAGDTGAGCCIGETGNVNYDQDDRVDSSDLGYLIQWLFCPEPGGCMDFECVDEADVNAQGGPNPVDSSDLGLLVGWLFADPPGSVTLPLCP